MSIYLQSFRLIAKILLGIHCLSLHTPKPYMLAFLLYCIFIVSFSFPDSVENSFLIYLGCVRRGSIIYEGEGHPRHELSVDLSTICYNFIFWGYIQLHALK